MLVTQKYLRVVALACGLTLGLVGPWARPGVRADDGATATLSVNAAAVSVTSAGVEHQGVDGETLYAGDSISTNPAGAAAVTFFDGSQVTLDAGTRLVVQELGVAPAGGAITDLVTTAGVTTSAVVPLVNGGGYEMHAPTSYAVVRGTRFRTRVVLGPVTGAVLEEGYSTTEGRVEVHVGDQVVTINPGQRVRIYPSPHGGPPQLVVEEGDFLTSTESGILGGVPTQPQRVFVVNGNVAENDNSEHVVDQDSNGNQNSNDNQNQGCVGGGTTPCPDFPPPAVPGSNT